MPAKILIIEDEISLRETLSYSLAQQGYDVEAVEDGAGALQAARRVKPDLVLLDIMLPGIDGFEVCRQLRQEFSMPILFVSARDEEFDRVIGLEIGGDDFITKPFKMRELVARVKAQLRTVQLIKEGIRPLDKPKIDTNTKILGNLTVHLNRREVLVNGELLPLKPKEYELLAFFITNQGQAFSREAIIKQVWDWDYVGETRTVDVHIRWLREKIEPDPNNPIRLVTVYGVGYRFDG